MTEHDPARQAGDYDTGAGWDRVADAMDRHGAAAVLADMGLVEDPPPWCDCCYGEKGGCECDETCPDQWPGDVSVDGGGYRPTVDAKVRGELL